LQDRNIINLKNQVLGGKALQKLNYIFQYFQVKVQVLYNLSKFMMFMMIGLQIFGKTNQRTQLFFYIFTLE